MRTHRNAFTLLEISVVIAIIGLLAGGIMAARGMMRAVELNRSMGDLKNYAVAIQQFKDKYGALPGDYPGATANWGRLNSNADCATKSGAAVSNAGVCDGNGDDSLWYAAAAGQSSEQFQMWRQLNLAGLVAGTFTGLNGPDGANYEVLPGGNSPAGPIEKSAFWIYDWAPQSTAEFAAGFSTNFFKSSNYHNSLVFGGQQAGNWNKTPIMTGAEAYQIDTKIDDGKPGTGMVMTLSKWWMDNNARECVSSNDFATAIYVRTPSSGMAHGCILVFPDRFMPKKMY